MLKLHMLVLKIRRLFCAITTAHQGDKRHERCIKGNCALLGHYAASSGNILPLFRDNLSVSSSRIKGTLLDSSPLTMEPDWLPESK
jgi:hypothetical protein